MNPLLRRRRGVTLIEMTVSMAVLSVAMLGMAQMQVVAVRTGRMTQFMNYATQLSRDLVENIAQWPYADTRLAAVAKVTSVADDRIKKVLGVGREESLGSTARLQYSADASDNNALTSQALGAYTGVSGDVDNDGKTDLRRYWNVFDIDSDNDGIAEGKVIVIIVRWKEPGLGMRNVVTTTFRSNPAVYSL